MSINRQILEQQETIFISKGRNRDVASKWLTAQGIKLPKLGGRRLH